MDYATPPLRLVRGDLSDDPVRDSEQIERISLAVNELSRILHTMRHRAVSAEPSPVAGRITAKASPLAIAVDDWLAHLRAQKRSDTTIAAYRGFVHTALRVNGWTSTADLTFENIQGYMDAAGQHWNGSTVNRNTTIWRSLTRYLVQRKMLEEDPLALVVRVPSDEGPGARAATTDEARTFLHTAYVRASTDARACPYNPVYYACMFLAGARHRDPARWAWGQILLDDGTPAIVWTPSSQKNRRRAVLALAPELADILRWYRDRARASGHDLGPDAPVFPQQPSPPTWRRYRSLSGIREADRFGMVFQGHSARKWLSTTMTNAGVPDKMVNLLMRHTSSVEARYYRPTLDEQRDALASLPEIWPVALRAERGAKQWTRTGCAQSRKAGLTRPGARADTSPATPGSLTSPNTPPASVRGPVDPPARCRNQAGSGVFHRGGRFGARTDQVQLPPSDGSNAISDTVIVGA